VIVMYGNRGSHIHKLCESLHLPLTEQDELSPERVRESKDPIVMFGTCPQKMEIIRECRKHSRPFYTIDAGYLGNVVGPAQIKPPQSLKDWWRFVPNGLQHTNYEVSPLSIRKHTKKVGIRPVDFDRGEKVLVVLPGPIAACYYGLNLKTLKKDILCNIQKHTDREIVFREKDPGGKKAKAKQRMRTHQFWKCLELGDVHCTVTWGSVASVESVLYGIPSIPLNPCAASHVCSDTLADIENPTFPSDGARSSWLEWLSRESISRSEIDALIEKLR
jgi:hypothetical protein